MLRLLTVVLFLLAPTGLTHYTFWDLIINGLVTGKWRYVREIPHYSTYIDEDAEYAGVRDIWSEGFRCGHNSFSSAAKTEVATIEAGSEIGFKVDDHDINVIQGGIRHYGPGAIYLSKAPGDVREYDGSGDWFKIDEKTYDYNRSLSKDYPPGQTDDEGAPHQWYLAGLYEYNFTIPRTTPPGQYLLRIEQTAISPWYNGSDIYLNCAQIEITGSGGGTPGPLVKIPGAYDNYDPGLWISAPRAHSLQTTKQEREFRTAGPAVWKG